MFLGKIVLIVFCYIIFFSVTKYDFLGFCLENEQLYAVVKQHFIKSNQETDLEKVKELLTLSGFINKWIYK